MDILFKNTNNTLLQRRVGFPVFGCLRTGGQETWTWRSLWPACSLQAQEQRSHTGKKEEQHEHEKIEVNFKINGHIVSVLQGE